MTRAKQHHLDAENKRSNVRNAIAPAYQRWQIEHSLSSDSPPKRNRSAPMRLRALPGKLDRVCLKVPIGPMQKKLVTRTGIV